MTSTCTSLQLFIQFVHRFILSMQYLVSNLDERKINKNVVNVKIHASIIELYQCISFCNCNGVLNKQRSSFL